MSSTLWQLRRGESCVIDRFDARLNDTYRTRMVELGFHAARTVESPRRRWLTYLAIPLMPCSARLPVYALLITAFIPAYTVLGGWVGLQGLAMLGIYLFGICSGLLAYAAAFAVYRLAEWLVV